MRVLQEWFFVDLSFTESTGSAGDSVTGQARQKQVFTFA
jgi:hypothetical protein